MFPCIDQENDTSCSYCGAPELAEGLLNDWPTCQTCLDVHTELQAIATGYQQSGITRDEARYYLLGFSRIASYLKAERKEQLAARKKELALARENRDNQLKKHAQSVKKKASLLSTFKQ